VLLPVQQLQGRLGDLAAYKDREILVYCATGNRSTVASKILIDNGFKQIVNMRHGIYDWAKKNFPVTR
jgi:rhodanese-related sulfurtransferase